MGKGNNILAILVVAMSTAGCATFEGMPRPVEMSAIDSYYSLASVRERIADMDDARATRERNAAAAMYLDAADREYAAFLVSIGVDRKAANLVLEGGTVLLGSAGAIAGKASNEISAAVAALAGARGAIDRELYYKQTLPAIVGAMETNRLKIKTQIRTHLLNDDITRYPLEQAWADLSEYRLAQSLDRAILLATKETGQAAAVEAARYENAIESCQPVDAMAPLWGRINDFVFTLAEAAEGPTPQPGSERAQKLEALHKVYQMLTEDDSEPIATTSEGATKQAEAILGAARAYCTVPKVNELLAEIASETGMTP